MPRNTKPFFLVMPPKERDRLQAFSKKVGRPMSWVTRDALNAYLNAVEADADLLARINAKMATPKLKPGRTPTDKRGRPRKGKA